MDRRRLADESIVDYFHFDSYAWWVGILLAAVLFVALTGRIYIALGFVAVRAIIDVVRMLSND